MADLPRERVKGSIAGSGCHVHPWSQGYSLNLGQHPPPAAGGHTHTRRTPLNLGVDDDCADGPGHFLGSRAVLHCHQLLSGLCPPRVDNLVPKEWMVGGPSVTPSRFANAHREGASRAMPPSHSSGLAARLFS